MILSQGKSDFLHALRWFAAALVLISHVQQNYAAINGVLAHVGDAWRYLGEHGHAAVVIFFVLSGFVVAYTSDVKSTRAEGYGFREYLLDRLSRIYSVLLPAVILTLVLDFVGSGFASYRNPDLLPQDYSLVRLVVNLFGLQGWWGYRIQLGSNPPLWSIGYELAFYFLWGIIYFRVGSRRWGAIGPWLLVSALLLFYGWKIAYYLLLWLLGMAAWWVSSRSATKIRLPLLFVLAVLVLGNEFINVQKLLSNQELINDALYAFLVAGVLAFDVRFPGFISERGRRINRYLADFSYSIYAYHYPIVFLLCSVMAQGAPLPYYLTNVLLVLLPLFLARALYVFTEAKRPQLKAAMARVWEA